jgi:flagellar export protein FliJ
MSEAQRKIKRVKPIIDLRRHKVQEETLVLATIRSEKQKTMREMLESQKKYMQGVEEMNRLRASKLRDNLQTLETTLDYVKSQWYRLYKQVQEIERKEQTQIVQLNGAQRDLKAIEMLEETYIAEFRKEQDRIEQRTMDEIALRKYVTR